MMLDVVKEWSSLAATLISLGTMVYVFLTASAKKTATDLDRYKKSNGEKLDGLLTVTASHASRLQALEQELEHLPNKAMVHDVQLTLKDIQIEMASLKALTEQATRTSQRVEGWLVERQRRSASDV